MTHTAEELDAQFEEFHAANPHVYHALVRLAREATSRGKSRVGMKMLWERLRWELFIATADGASDYRLNNNLHSRYARLLMANEPDLDGLFLTRERVAA